MYIICEKSINWNHTFSQNTFLHRNLLPAAADVSVSCTDCPCLTFHPCVVLASCWTEGQKQTQHYPPSSSANVWLKANKSIQPPLFPLLITDSLPEDCKCSRGSGRLWQRRAWAQSITGQNEWPPVAQKPEGLLAHRWLCSWHADIDAANVV